MAKTNTLTVVKPDTQTHPNPVESWLERPISERWLFRGETEDGRRGWFLRLDITGLYSRRFGPFRSRAAALESLEKFLGAIVTEPLCDLENDMEDSRYYVIEGVPRLKSR